jgi:hypothetical protein
MKNNHTSITINYSKLNRLCLVILWIALIAFAVAYFLNSKLCMAWSGGSIATIGLVLVALNPIEGN